MSVIGETAGHGAPALEALLPAEKVQLHDTRLDALEAKCGLASNIVDGLKSEALSLRLTGLPQTDRASLKEVLAESEDLMIGMPDNFSLIRSGVYLPAQSRAERRSKNTFSLQNPATAALHKRYDRLHTAGCFHDPFVYQAALSHRLRYAFEGMPSDVMLTAENVQEDDIRMLFGADQNTDEITNEQLVSKMRERQIPDHSKETLDNVFAGFVGLAQTELLYHTSLDLLMLGRMGGKTKSGYVQDFMREHEAVLFGDDLQGKLGSYRELGKATRTFSEREQNRDTSFFLKTMSASILTYAGSLEREVSHFSGVYDYFGYQKPDLLRTEHDNKQNEQAVGTAESPAEPAQTSVEAAVGSTALDETVEIVSAFQKLDQFILPPDATSEDIDRELKRIGVDES